MKRIMRMMFVAGLLLGASGILWTGKAQMGWGGNTGHGHGGGMYWADSVQVEQRSGVVIVDSTGMYPMYYLDEDGDGTADVQLMFGPYWYQPQSGAHRPQAGDSVVVTGEIYSMMGGYMMGQSQFIVYTINGVEWRPPAEITEHGWNPAGFWADTLETVEVSGTVLVDTTGYVWHYFLDEDGDSLPDYMLNFGPYWYRPASGITRPLEGETVTIRGGLHTGMLGYQSIMVYEINGQKWREDYGPGAWRGGWVHRNASGTTTIFCSADSLSHVAFGAGAMMGGMMGQPSFPDSVFVQFELVHPDLMPGNHDSTFFMGFFMNIYAPDGSSMMMSGGQWGMHHGMMRFNSNVHFQFHYTEEQLRNLGLDESKIHLMYWNEDMQSWMPVQGATVDTSSNVVVVTSDETYNYYALASSPLATGVHEVEGAPGTLAESFALDGSYPNPVRMNGSASRASIRFQLAREASVSLWIFDLRGRVVLKRNLGVKAVGAHAFAWDGRDMSGQDVASGVYLITLKANGLIKTAKLTLVR